MSKTIPHVSFHEKRFLYTYSKDSPAQDINTKRQIIPLENIVSKNMPKSPRRSSTKRVSKTGTSRKKKSPVKRPTTK